MIEPGAWAGAVAVALFAGTVKGLVGFAMPMIMVSGLSLFLPVETALAGLIGATFVSNVAQMLRQGWVAAKASIWAFRRFIVLVMVCIAICAQSVQFIPHRLFYAIVGSATLLFGLTQILGWQLRYSARTRPLAECLMGILAGTLGGISGIWGPPTVAFLLPLNLEKAAFVRIQGVIYGLGAMMLAAAHGASGILNAHTLPLSISLIVPALIGLRLGFWLQDRLDRKRFVFVILAVLVVVGANLLRRAIWGD